jgi:hypothetical protein
LLTARPAHADWYSDAKDIIRQLIENNIATNVVPKAAAHVPMLCEFFPSSLAAIQATRFSGLPKVIRKEIADVVGFQVAVQLQPAADQERKIKTFLATDLTARANGKIMPAIAIDVDKVVVPDQVKTLFNKKDQIPKACAGALPSDADENTKPDFSRLQSVATKRLRDCATAQSDPQQEIACAAAIMTRDVVAGDDALISPDLRRLLTALAAESVSKLKLSADDYQAFRALLDQAIQAKTVSSALASTVAEKLYDAYVQRVLAAIGDVAQRAAKEADLAKQKIAEIQARVEVLLPVVSFLAGARFDAITLEQALALAQSLAAQCKATNDTCKALASLVAATETDAGRLVRYVEAKDFGGAAGAVIDIVARVKCPEGDAKEKTPGCSELDRAALNFIRKLAVYTVDAVGASGATTTSDADFRRAAVELIELVSGPGIRRVSGLNIFRHWSTIVPKFSLRKAYRPDRPSESGSTLVTYPSIDALMIRKVVKNYDSFFASVNFTVIDLLGPFTELATRPIDLQGKGSGSVFALGFIVPRLEFELAIPALTNNIVVGAGVATRFYRVSRPDTMSGLGPSYCTCSSLFSPDDCTDGASSLGAKNVEFSVFVKYVP